MKDKCHLHAWLLYNFEEQAGCHLCRLRITGDQVMSPVEHRKWHPFSAKMDH